MQKQSLADSAYDKLRDLIITLDLEPGQIVSESEISQKLGIGRMPIRDAFRRLDSEGLVEVLSRKGVLISPIRAEELFLQLEVRSVLETLIVKRACKYATQAERERLLELADSYESATLKGDPLAAIRIDEAFHALLGECAHNRFAEMAIAPLYAKFQRIFFNDYRADNSRALKNNYLHIELMRAIAAGTVDESIRCLNSLLQNLEDHVRSRMETWLPDRAITPRE